MWRGMAAVCIFMRQAAGGWVIKSPVESRCPAMAMCMESGCAEDFLPPGKEQKPPSSSSSWFTKAKVRVASANAEKQDHSCDDPQCVQCRWNRNRDKWQDRATLVQRKWRLWLTPSDQMRFKDASWLEEKFDDNGEWVGLGCIACAAERTASPSPKKKSPAPSPTDARGFATWSCNSTNGLHIGNIMRHHNMAGHKEACLILMGVDATADARLGAPTTEHFNTVFKDITNGTAPSRGLTGIGKGGKITRMVCCLSQAKSRIDRSFMKRASMCSHQRDEAHGRLALRCCAVTRSLERKRFHMSTQKKMGTGATNITLATDKGWKEFCTAGHGVLK